ncbi:PKD domain-containing protein [Pseudoalteromonas peptidolytica]|uniref:Ig-like domain-containing protein n=1 Tax=Pseudoalteromonas peptidolytica F12-50-A1 TaxID=1315280 RepID=A0A8I0T373_9GAMM|nr:M10 family metallopeptidase C-terminal domain-containing protein [Pseudoalteromonas peptidolytica]MBE0344957.1 hypothetical protein [Pseudoalteromonas peptidolytica F12-50-A1]NLR15564.1 hypothetical protein [Pseudoalteromonas peptidolytica]GEK08320.1 hypothetical protein PPE03_05690 [Pseudoalteromonas peptidolytica]
MKKLTITPIALVLASFNFTSNATEPFDMNTTHSYVQNEKYSKQYVLDALVLNEESRWNYNNPLGTSVTVTYAFAGSDFGYPYADCCVERDFKDYEKEAFLEVFENISSVTGVTFVEVSDVANTNIIFTISSNAAGAEFPPTNDSDASRPRIVHVGENDYLNYLDPNRDIQPYDRKKTNDIDFKHDVSRSKDAIVHEVLHALGLKHPAYIDNGTIVRLLDDSEENKMFTAMSYNLPATTSELYKPTTVKKYDVVALQHLYGAPAKPIENDHYEYDDTFSYHKMIVDTDGIDTISVTNSERNNVIDLRSGAFSSIAPNPTGFYDADVGGEHMNRSHNSLAISFDTVIENAIGGSGNDTLVGNEANNELDGGLGSDKVIYPGNKADYSIDQGDNFVTVTSLSTGDVDSLKSIEVIEFKDQTVILNNAPVLTMPDDLTVRLGSPVELTVVASDADGDALTFNWGQTGGSGVTLNGSDTATVSFTAPLVDAVSTVILEASVSDSVDNIKGEVTVTIQPNNSPVIELPADQTVNEGDSVSLSVTASDDDNDALSYRWLVNGASITLSGDTTNTVSFTAPDVSNDTGITVEVFVSDGFDEVSTSSIVTVKNVETSTSTPETTQPEKSSSGGSFGWLMLLLCGGLLARRKN